MTRKLPHCPLLNSVWDSNASHHSVSQAVTEKKNKTLNFQHPTCAWGLTPLWHWSEELGQGLLKPLLRSKRFETLWLLQLYPAAKAGENQGEHSPAPPCPSLQCQSHGTALPLPTSCCTVPAQINTPRWQAHVLSAHQIQWLKEGQA